MPPAPFARPKIRPEELKKKGVESSKIYPPEVDASQPPSRFCGPPISTAYLQHKESTGQSGDNIMDDEIQEAPPFHKKFGDSSSNPTSSLCQSKQKPRNLHAASEQETNSAETATISNPVAMRLPEEGLDTNIHDASNRKGNLGRVLASKSTTTREGQFSTDGLESAGLQQPSLILRAEVSTRAEDRGIQSHPSFPNQSLLVHSSAASDISQPQRAVDLGPVSIGIYPSKDPSAAAAVVVLPDRRRHHPSFDESYASFDSSTPQQAQIDSLQADLLWGVGSSAASLASSSTSAIISRQASLAITPPPSIGGTPVATLSKHGSEVSEKPPCSIVEDTSKVRDGIISFESQKSRNFPVLYSAIGSLEDPAQLGSSWRKKKGGEKQEEPAKRDFPSVVNSSKAHRGKTKRLQSKANASVLGRRSSFGDAAKTDMVELDDVPKAPVTTSKHSKKGSPDKDLKGKRGRRKEMFRPSSDAYTPRIENRKDIKFKPAEMRTPVMAGSMGSLHRPNYSDALRRVAMIIRQHIVKIESRFEDSIPSSVKKANKKADGLFLKSMEDMFAEAKFVIPRYRCTMVRVPMAVTGMACGLKRIRESYAIPSEAEIYEFANKLFKTVQLSSECSIVSLIYIERLMETAHVPLLSTTWRPILISGLLMASKVWQDLSSWNIEFSNVYPQYALESINNLELQFLRLIKWDLYISSSLYAKYYFALRSLDGKHDFRKRYNHMVGGDGVRHQQARKIEERTMQVKEEALQQLSRSM